MHPARREAEKNEQSASPTGAINSLGNKIDGYIEQQDRSERGKHRRETLTIIGIFITAVIALGQGWVLFKQYGELHATDITLNNTLKAQAESSERQLRAYVGMDNAHINVLDENPTVEIFVSFKNSGQTPAYNAKASVSTKVAFPKHEPWADTGVIEGAESTSFIGPGLTAFRRQIRTEFSKAHLEAIRQGIMNFFVWGRIDYIDAFKQDRWFIFHAINDRHPAPNTKTYGLITHPKGYNAN